MQMKLHHRWHLCLFASDLQSISLKFTIILGTFPWKCPPFFCTVWGPENSAHFRFMSLESDASFIHNLSSTIAAITVPLASGMNSEIQQSLRYGHLLGEHRNLLLRMLPPPLPEPCAVRVRGWLSTHSPLASISVPPSLRWWHFTGNKSCGATAHPSVAWALLGGRRNIERSVWNKCNFLV